ncbi:hypothetical protein [Micromonospora zhanjiangensis]|uniref:Cytochrome P450 n=1 Tax=Micromonospora zhanjiangensis TaxID=1522057 RepID=A0ABV8KVY8_9ACTN
MRQIDDPKAARAVLHDPNFVVPPVPAGAAGIGWLRATVGRFSTGEAYARRRALSVAVLAGIAPESLRVAAGEHPVAALARAMGVERSVGDRPAVDSSVGGRSVGDQCVVELVRAVAQAYRPGTGDDARADAAVERLVALLGGGHDESTAARIGVLVQACDATAVLVDRARHRPVEEVLRDDPPVPATLRRALAATTVGGVTVAAGETIRVRLAGDLAFGAGPRRCPGRAHALALTRGPTGAAD